MGRASGLLRVGEWLWLLAWAAASSAWCLSAGGQLSATYDEPFYLEAGLKGWRTRSHQDLLAAGTMPLPPDVQTLPLYLAERWRGSPADLGADFERWLPLARATTLGFWWLLLFYGWRAGRQIGGPWAGALAVGLLACEPNLLAHAGLATTDVALSACLLALVYHFRTGREAGWLRRVGLPALWFAAAVASKTSALVFGPVCLAAVELERLARAGPLRPLLPAGRDLAAITLGGLLLALVYCGAGRHPVKPPQGHRLQAVAFVPRQALAWLEDQGRNAEEVYKGTLFQVHHNMDGHGATYLLGQTFDRPVWYYFPLVLCIKLPLSLLALPLLVVALRPRALANWACAAALALLAVSPTFRVQIGVRFVLPLVGLAVVGLAAAAVEATRGAGWRRYAGVAAALGGLLWGAASVAAVWPDGLRYTNECWGGTELGYRRLSDSNYDWGQGLKELARWQQERGVSDLDVWYFGTDPAIRSLPVRAVGLPTDEGQGPDALLARVRGRHLAASLTFLYGGYKDTWGAARFLRRYRPVARTGTFFIYDFTREEDGIKPPGCDPQACGAQE